MSASWNGWDESEVRSKRLADCDHAEAPDAKRSRQTGFTAINSSSLNVATINRTHRSVRSTGDRRTVASDFLDHDRGADPCIEFLGVRSKPLSNLPILREHALHGPGARKAGKGRKRSGNSGLAGHTSSSSAHIDVSSGMSVSKPCGKATKADEDRGHPIAIFTPTTSMHVVRPMLQTTSLDAIRATPEKGYTMYQGRAAVQHRISENNVQFSHPWLTDVTAAKATLLTGRGKATKRGKSSAASAADLPSVEEEDELCKLFDDTGSQVPSGQTNWQSAQSKIDVTTAKSSKQPPAKAENQRRKRNDSDNYFFDDDDDVASEALQLIETIESSALRHHRGKDAVSTQLMTPYNSDSALDIDKATRKQAEPNTTEDTIVLENEYMALEDEYMALDDDDNAAAELIDLTNNADNDSRLPTPPPRLRAKNVRAVEPHDDYGGALLDDAEQALIAKLAGPADVGNRPIARKPFPVQIRDRSPIFGVSATTVLRTCFRVGEALNTGCQAHREKRDLVVELYARVTSSWREPKGRRQHVMLKDLYHDRPPHLNGTFELFEQSPLWDLDSKVFLVRRPEGVMCRCIGRMKHDDAKWKLEILSIWEASWEDVDFVAGIYTGAVKDEE